MNLIHGLLRVFDKYNGGEIMDKILKDLYDSEINFYLISNWDAGYEIGIGNGFGQTTGAKKTESLVSLDEAIEWLKTTAIELYPDSTFTKAYS